MQAVGLVMTIRAFKTDKTFVFNKQVTFEESPAVSFQIEDRNDQLKIIEFKGKILFLLQPYFNGLVCLILKKTDNVVEDMRVIDGFQLRTLSPQVYQNSMYFQYNDGRFAIFGFDLLDLPTVQYTAFKDPNLIDYLAAQTQVYTVFQWNYTTVELPEQTLNTGYESIADSKADFPLTSLVITEEVNTRPFKINTLITKTVSSLVFMSDPLDTNRFPFYYHNFNAPCSSTSFASNFGIEVVQTVPLPSWIEITLDNTKVDQTVKLNV